MKKNKEYEINKTVLNDGTIYFIGNDFMIIRDKFFSCNRNKINTFEIEDMASFKRMLDEKINNKEKIII